MKTLIIVLFLTLSVNLFAQVSGDYRSGTTSVTWSTAANWETYNGSIWVTATSKPGASNSVYIQRGHTVTLTGNESCNDLHLNRDNNTTILALGTNTLNLNGKLRAYIGTVGTIPGTSSNDPNGTASWITSTTGKISVVGNSHTVTVSGEWGNGNAGASSPNGFDMEINMNAGQTATLNTFFKSRTINVVTGTLNVPGEARMAPDQGTRNNSNFTVQSGATFISAASGNTTNSVVGLGDLNLGDTLWIKSGATMILTGATSFISMATVILDGTVIYPNSANQNMADRTNSGAAPSAYTNLILKGSGLKKFTNSNNSVSGTFSIQDSATFSLNSNALTYGASSTLEYASTNFSQTTTTGELNTSGARVPHNLLIKSGASVTLANDVTFGNSCSVVSETGSTLDAGVNSLTFGTSGIVTVGGTLRTSSVSGLNGGAGTTILTTNSPSLSLTGSTIEYYSGSTQVITPGLSYANMIISGAGNKTIGSTVNLTGDLTLNGSVTVTGANLTMSGNISGTGSQTGTGSISMSGSGKTLSGSLTLANFTNFSSGTNTVTGITSIGVLNLSTGTLADGGLTIPVTGNITGTATHSGAGKLQLTGAGGKTISGATLGNLQLNNAGGFSLTGNAVITGTLTLTAGTLTVGANTLTIQNAIAGIPTNLTAGSTSSITVSGSGSGISLPSSVTALKDLTVSNANGLAIGANMTITGTANITGLLSLGSLNMIQAGGAATLSGNGTIQLSGALGTQRGTYNTNTFSGTYEFTGSLQSIPAGIYTNPFKISGTGVSLGGNVSLSGVLNLSINTLTIGANTLTFSGSSPVRTSGNIDASNASATVAFTNTSGTITLPSSMFTGNVKNFTASGSGGTVTLSQSIAITGVATIGSGASLNLGSFNFTQSGTATLTGNGTIQLTGSIASQIGTYNTNTFSGTEEFIGSSQVIPTGNYPNIKVNGTGLSISGSVTLSGALTMTSGNITLGAFNISTVDIIGGSSSSYISTTGAGKVTRTGLTSSSSETFPIGNGSYTPVTITNSSGPTESFAVSVQNSLDNAVGGTNFVQKQWNISEGTVGGNSAIVAITWNAAEEGAGMTSENPYHSTTTIGHWTDSNYYRRVDGAITGSNPYTITSSTQFTTFSPFTVGSSGVLPVELESFTSTMNGRNVNLKWTTNAEQNNSGFDVERKSMVENATWSKVGNMVGNGTSNVAHTYSFSDRNLQTGDYNYRLKQIDHNGNYRYYDLSNEVIIGVPTKFDISQNYPNPFNPTTKINYDLPVDAKVSIAIYDMTGKEVTNLVNGIQTAGSYTVSFNAAALSSGIYFYQIIAAGSQNFNKTMRMVLVK